MPRHLQVVDGLEPGVALRVEGDAHDVEALVVIFGVGGLHVGHLGTAGTAPRSPEVEQHILALADILGELVHLAVLVGHLEVGELTSYLLALGGLLLLEHALHRGVVQELVAGRGDELFLLVLVQAAGETRIVESAHQVVLILFEESFGSLAERALCILEHFHNLGLASRRGVLVAILRKQLLLFLARHLVAKLLHHTVVVGEGCRAPAALHGEVLTIVGKCGGLVLQGEHHHLRQLAALHHQLGYGGLGIGAAQGELAATNHR